MTIRPGLAHYRGALGANGLHHHHAVQVLISRGEPLIVGDAQGNEVECLAAVTPADIPHTIVRGVVDGEMLHAARESVYGSALEALVPEPHSAASWGQAGARLLELGVAGEWWRAGDRLNSPVAMPFRHPALVASMQLLPDLLAAGPVRLREVAAAAGISESRLGHLFAEQLGLPFRAYVRWLRLSRAVEFIARGSSLTEAAHLSGFSDSAHLNRVCHRSFGLAPTALTERIKFTVVE
ncbi:MAG: helix-turn-helix transcriptional regulator [Mycobacteriaceae bacterium]|nr:helix-turn-helix transcriptional regulator [Mycobacteriaceae bacterium]